MTHVADGVLRRYLDEPGAMTGVDRAHLGTCPRCAAELRTAEDDRDMVARALGRHERGQVGAVRSGPGERLEPVLEDPVDRAWSALMVRLAEPAASRTGSSDVTAAGPRPPGPTGRRTPMRQRVVRHPVAAALSAAVVVLGGTAAAAAADWLPIFRTARVSPVTISAQDLTAMDQVGRLAQLSAYGSVVLPSDTGLTGVPDAASAAASSGLRVPTVGSLPTGVTGRPRYQVLPRQSAEFTFSAAAASRTAATEGITLPPMPPGLDGSRLLVQGGPGVVLTWTQPSGVPTLVVARVSAPTVASQGAPLSVVRDYLLSLPGIPADVADQLRSVTASGTTLPIPVPAGMATASRAGVDGAQATVVQTTDGAAAGVVWVTQGQLEAVLGPLSRDEVLAVARGLR